MRIDVISKNVDVTPAIRALIEKKASKLRPFVSDDASIRFMIDANQNRHKIEATLYVDGRIIRAEQRSDDLYKTIDQTVDVLIKRLKNYKEKKHEKVVRSESIRRPEFVEEADQEESLIVRRKIFVMNSMSAEDACAELRLLGHSFFVFRDSDTDKISVVYEREDGGYGLIAEEVRR